jgi:hypothetical protein
LPDAIAALTNEEGVERLTRLTFPGADLSQSVAQGFLR